MKKLMQRGFGYSPAQFLALVDGNPFRTAASPVGGITAREAVLMGRQALDAMGGTFLTAHPGNTPLALATVPQTVDTFTAAHSARISALAQEEKAERLKGELAPLLERFRLAVREAREEGLFAVDVPLTGARPELRLALLRALQDRGFAVRDVTTGFTLGWQPAPTPRPPAYRTGQALQTPGPHDLIPGPRRGPNLLREAPEEGGPPE